MTDITKPSTDMPPDTLTQRIGALTRRYAEMYSALGIPELGAVFSCNRDYAMVGGFNADAKLRRTQTIMEGASHYDFRFRFPQPD